MSGWDAIVVGAGICGLAAGYELARRGQRVLVLDAVGVGAGQSAGLARIFRIAHGDPRLCERALEAERGWRRWERELGARLLGSEGLVVAGPERTGAWQRAMEAAGALAHPLDRTRIAERVPLLGPGHPWDEGLFDPLAGSLRTRRVLRHLADAVTVERATVTQVGEGGTVRTAGGDELAATAILVCAGTATGPLVDPLGIDVHTRATHHVRLTYEARERKPTACLIAPEAYGVPVGSTGRFALGMRDEGDGLPFDPATADDAAAATRRQHAGWVPSTFPKLNPEPVGEVRCVGLQASWLDDSGDGFVVARAGPVIAVGASNVMKFGPVVGDRLATEALAIHS